MKPLKRRQFLVGASSALLLPACVSKPQMQLHHAEIRSANPLGIGMEVFFSVRNDNSFDVQVRNVRAQTVLQGRYSLPALDYSPNLWLPSDRTIMVSAPTTIPWPLVPPLLGETITKPSISYRVKGSADVTATSSLKIKSDNYPVDEEGSIPRIAVLQLAQSMFPGIR
ncbi:MAG: hypothetical protein KIT72_00745 [Polyangiaceae bacterium]|nr:hypothetical protein [Polyangiaceae bacterium]MCW5788923.1 hypothetical protein [Polyangiaceae bacterium]